MKQRKKSRKSLVKELDRMSSKLAIWKWIRDWDEWCQFCILRDEFKKTRVNQCFHLFSSQKYSARWQPMNTLASCGGCNIRYEQDSHFVANVIDWYKTKFGQDAYDALYKIWAQVGRVSTPDLRNLHKKIKFEYDEVFT